MVSESKDKKKKKKKKKKERENMASSSSSCGLIRREEEEKEKNIFTPGHYEPRQLLQSYLFSFFFFSFFYFFLVFLRVYKKRWFMSRLECGASNSNCHSLVLVKSFCSNSRAVMRQLFIDWGQPVTRM